MKNYIYSTIIFFLIISNAFGQSPNWSVNENNFQFTMTFVGFLNSDGIGLVNSNDKVAAFVNGECRGVANVIYVPSEKRYCTYLTVFSNTTNETISFKIYDSTNNIVKSIEKTIPFKNNEHYGNLFQAYSFASPALNEGVEMLDVSFKDVIRNNIIIVDSLITIYLNKGQQISALNTVFTTSLGANVYRGTTKQISGANTLDFTSPIIFNVLSENESKSKTWTIVVKTSLADATYYKKDAACYEGGVIKVLFPVEKEEVSLTRDGMILYNQIINNGQAIFNNLNEGIYRISVGGNFKDIIIKLK